MNKLISISRIIVGLLFIFSGLVKANDPLGLAYKMQEFFEVWAQDGFLPGIMHGMNDYALAFSIVVIAFEIIAGVAVILGWRMKLFSWLLLLLIIFFTFLTGYAYLSGKFRSCGCFGDCIPITPKGSFIKDLVLLGLIGLIFLYREKIRPVLSNKLNIALLAVTAAFSFAGQWYVLKYLPVVDCLPYKAGKNISDQMKIPPGSIPDSTVITFVYEKDSKQVEFDADHFPADFNDSAYKFIKRYDKLVRKGNAEPPVKDFILKTLSGNDTTQALLSSKGHMVFAFVKDSTVFKTDYLKLRQQLSAQKNIPLYIVTSRPEQITVMFKENEIDAAKEILVCDFVAIKTASRAGLTFYLLKDGTIVNKWSYADFDKAFDFITSLPAGAN